MKEKDDVNMRAVLALADKASYHQIETILMAAGVEVVGFADNGLKALYMVKQMMPDILLSDMVLPTFDGRELICRINELKLYTMPVILLMSHPHMERYEQEALDAGVFRVLRKPLTREMIIKAVEAIDVEARVAHKNGTEARIDEYLGTLGLKSKLAGTKYLCTAIALVSKDSRLLDALTTKLYPIVGEKHGVDGKCVERCMRRAIESAWSTGALEVQHALFGDAIDAGRGKPTCGGMIARIADLLRMKE